MSCSVLGCTNSLYCKGFCVKHYQKWKKYGDPTFSKIHKYKACKLCNKPNYCRGLCLYHYTNLVKYGDVKHERQYRKESQTKDPLYTTWAGMVSRCTVKSNSSYRKYGQKGIKVCNRWLGKDGFFNFKLDMGNKPSSKYSLDRIDPNSDYSPENCRWASIHTQATNKRKQSQNIGVYKHLKGGYEACIQINNIVYRKYFKELTDAVSFRKQMELKYHVDIQNGVRK